MPPWQVQLLGELRICRGERVITRFRTRATDAVFAYLALHLGKQVPRDRLIELMWPESGGESGRQSLRTALTSIRRALGDETLRANRSAVELVPEHFEVDALAFKAQR